MGDARAQACREILERLAVAARIDQMRAELRTLGAFELAAKLPAAIRHEHARVHVLAESLGLPLLPMRDVAAFARAQIGLPLNAKLLPARSRPPQWSRDLSIALLDPPSSASSPAA